MSCAASSLELLAAAPEHERVTALEPRHALAGARQLQQQLVDPLLLAALAGLLADENALGVAPRAPEHCLPDQAVVENHVRLLQQLQRAQGQQVGVAGPGADQVDLAELRAAAGGRRGRELRGQQLLCEAAARRSLVAGEHAARNTSRGHPLPESAARGRRQRALHPGTQPSQEAGEGAEALGQQRLDLCAHLPCQHRRLSGGAHRHQQRRTVDDRREDERGAFRVVDHVHRDVARAGER